MGNHFCVGTRSQPRPVRELDRHLLGITGTLGGHLVGIYTEVSVALRVLGWDVYTTYYVPDMTLVAIGVIATLLLGLAWWSRSKAV